MDIEKIFNHESQWFKNDTDSDFNQNLYSGLSLQQEKSQYILSNASYTLSDVIDDIRFNFNIIDTPIIQLIEYTKHKPQYIFLDQQSLFVRLRKIKMNLKKQRAKNRNQKKQQYYDQIPHINLKMEMTEEDKKRQKNRISAQISRDKKKDYILDLMKQNDRLVEQKKDIVKQNQQLRRKICQRVQKIQKKPKKYNIFIQTIIFIGLLFLFSIFKSQNYKNNLSSGQLVQKIQINQKQKKSYLKKYKPKGKSIIDKLICRAFQKFDNINIQVQSKRIPKVFAQNINKVKETILN